MASQSLIAVDEIERLRQKHYNAAVVAVRCVHRELLILRVRRDAGKLPFRAGQYVALGLGAWEPRVAAEHEEMLDEQQLRHVVKRAYSIGNRLLDDQGRLVRATEELELEFFLNLAPEEVARSPGLTHRLFALKPSDRLFVGAHAHGGYTLDAVGPDDQVVFVATGTGEAPHNAMLAELLARQHPARIVAITCARLRADLAYLDVHRQLEARFGNYQYIALTTREPENVDQTLPGYIGKRYVQNFFESGEFEQATGLRLDPQATHIFLCGNPAMIGVPSRPAAPREGPVLPPGMLEVLERRGFQSATSQTAGNLHYERYW